MKRRNSKGQSILEYTLLIGIIIAAIVWVLLGNTGGKSVKQSVQNTYNKAGAAIDATTNNLTGGVFGS